MLLQYLFGPWPISADEVFAKTQLSYAFVNLKPIVPGGYVLRVVMIPAAVASRQHHIRNTPHEGICSGTVTMPLWRGGPTAA
jgi:hypothetical protein